MTDDYETPENYNLPIRKNIGIHARNLGKWYGTKSEGFDTTIAKHKNILGGTFLILLILVTIVFAILALIASLQGSSSSIWGLYATNIALSLLTIVLTYTQNTYLALFFGVCRFVLALAGLSLLESNGSVSCNNPTYYRIYMAAQATNVILLFFNIIAAILPSGWQPRMPSKSRSEQDLENIAETEMVPL